MLGAKRVDESKMLGGEEYIYIYMWKNQVALVMVPISPPFFADFGQLFQCLSSKMEFHNMAEAQRVIRGFDPEGTP